MSELSFSLKTKMKPILYHLCKILDKVVKTVVCRIFSFFIETINVDTRDMQTIMKDISSGKLLEIVSRF